MARTALEAFAAMHALLHPSPSPATAERQRWSETLKVTNAHLPFGWEEDDALVARVCLAERVAWLSGLRPVDLVTWATSIRTTPEAPWTPMLLKRFADDASKLPPVAASPASVGWSWPTLAVTAARELPFSILLGAKHDSHLVASADRLLPLRFRRQVVLSALVAPSQAGPKLGSFMGRVRGSGELDGVVVDEELLARVMRRKRVRLDSHSRIWDDATVIVIATTDSKGAAAAITRLLRQRYGEGRAALPLVIDLLAVPLPTRLDDLIARVAMDRTGYSLDDVPIAPVLLIDTGLALPSGGIDDPQAQLRSAVSQWQGPGRQCVVIAHPSSFLARHPLPGWVVIEDTVVESGPRAIGPAIPDLAFGAVGNHIGSGEDDGLQRTLVGLASANGTELRSAFQAICSGAVPDHPATAKLVAALSKAFENGDSRARASVLLYLELRRSTNDASLLMEVDIVRWLCMLRSQSYALLATAGRFLDHQRFDGRNLHGVPSLEGACLRRSTFIGADMYRIDLAGADLQRAALSNADLSRAHLKRADLRGADLRSADLSYACLDQADLRGADLRGARLRGTSFTAARGLG